MPIVLGGSVTAVGGNIVQLHHQTWALQQRYLPSNFKKRSRNNWRIRYVRSKNLHKIAEQSDGVEWVNCVRWNIAARAATIDQASLPFEMHV